MQTVNEASFDDVFDMAKGVLNVATGAVNNGPRSKYSYSSIAKAASKLIAVFPVITSRTVSPETAQNVTKFIEQKACNLFVIALQQLNVSSAKSGIEYMQQFHQNLDFGGSGVDTVIKTMQSWLDAYEDGKLAESVSSAEYVHGQKYDDGMALFEADNITVDSRELRDLMQLMEANSNIKFYDTQLNPLSVNDYIVNEFDNGTYSVSVKKLDYLDEAGDDDYDDEKLLIRKNSGRNTEFLKDQDIKKMNDAVPSLLVVRFYQSDTATVATEFIIGVKSKLIPVTTSEVLRRIVNNNKDGKKFLKFMRLITGELKASEVMFGLSRIKDDLKSCKVKGAYGDTWNLLKNRADAARTQVRTGQRNDYSAISVVVISQADADELFREENIDITKPSNALGFMDAYNLMGFAIVDDSTESLKVLFDDGTKVFEEISYRMLERENQDGTYKKLINLMAASK